MSERRLVVCGDTGCMRASTAQSVEPRSWRSGLAWGLGVGAGAWVLYFIQASTANWLFWDVTVVPALVVVSAIAVAVAVARPRLRSFHLGLAVGALAMIPAVLLAFGLVFAVFDLE